MHLRTSFTVWLVHTPHKCSILITEKQFVQHHEMLYHGKYRLATDVVL